MDELSKLFYDPLVGFTGLKELKRRYFAMHRKNKLKLSDKDIEDFYWAQPINQVFKTQKSKSNIPFNVKEKGRIACDLIDMNLLKRRNNNFKWILTAIDMRSRYAWAFPVKNKSPSEILEHLKTLPLTSLTVDDGGEFKGVIKKWCFDNNIDVYVGNPAQNTKGRTALVEGLNRRLLAMLWKYMRSRDDYRWVDVLSSIVSNYNTGKSLEVAFKSRDSGKLVDPFKIGDYVRTVIPRNVFTKAMREPNWSEDVYQILTRDGARYKLIDHNYKMLPIAYLPRQLLPAKLNDTSVHIVIDNETEEDDVEKLKNAKRFLKAQRQSGLDVDEDGNIQIPKMMKPKK